MTNFIGFHYVTLLSCTMYSSSLFFVPWINYYTMYIVHKTQYNLFSIAKVPSFLLSLYHYWQTERTVHDVVFDIFSLARPKFDLKCQQCSRCQITTSSTVLSVNYVTRIDFQTIEEVDRWLRKFCIQPVIQHIFRRLALMPKYLNWFRIITTTNNIW